MWLGPGHEQSLEIQPVETAIRQQNHPRAWRNQLLGRLDQQCVKLLSFGAAARKHIAPAKHRLPVRLDQGIDPGGGTDCDVADLRWGNNPKVRGFLSHPIKQKYSFRAARDFLRMKVVQRKRDLCRRAKAL